MFGWLSSAFDWNNLELQKVSEIPEDLIKEAGAPSSPVEGAELYIIKWHGAPLGYVIKNNANSIAEVRVKPVFRGIAKYALCKLGVSPDWEIRTANAFGRFNVIYPDFYAVCKNFPGSSAMTLPGFGRRVNLMIQSLIQGGKGNENS